MAQISTQICGICTKSCCVLYCYECQYALCTSCRELHDKIPVTSEHTLTSTSTIDIAVVSKKSTCIKHDKEFLFFCVNCSDFICKKCVISTHKDHSFSGINETVSEERKRAKLQISDLKSKIEPIPSIKNKVRCCIDYLKLESKKCVETIDNVSEDIQIYVEERKTIKKTEVEDFETWEHQRCKLFMEDIKKIYRHYTQVISELENLLSEKHDITFHSCYRVLNIDIQNLVDVPDEPSFAQVSSFQKDKLYREIIAHMESKVDESLCESCTNHRKKIDEILIENEILKTRFESCTTQITQRDDEIRSLTLEIDDLKNKLQDVDVKEDTENRLHGVDVKEDTEMR